MRSRLASNLKKSSIRNGTIALVGIVAILYVLFQYGLPFLVSASFAVRGGTIDEDIPSEKLTDKFIEPPILSSLPVATNTATIDVKGTGKKDTTINLYVNNELVDKKTIHSSTFTFNDIRLQEGRNTIKLNASKKDSQSENTEAHVISYLNKAPEVTIDSPSDNQEYSKDNKTAQVKGKTDPNSKVTVNDQWAIMDGTGTFTYNLPLHDGDNDIKIVVTDQAGNKAETNRKVKYSP